MRRGRALAAVALAAGALAACGDDGGDDDRAAAFRERSSALCREVDRAADRVYADFERRVEDVTRTGDPEALRQEVLAFLDALGETVVQPFFARSKTILPPDDPEAWEELQRRGEVAGDRLVERARKRVEDARLRSARDLTGVLDDLGGVQGELDRLTGQAEAVYRRYGVDACLPDGDGGGAQE